ncbi:MAG: RNA pseudouridine synthase [Chitinophagaceae bacterium]|nr:MAG: RNA pseudouridine synthase [Chitinophagaceae bacterium]
MKVLYEDNHYIAIQKKSGELSQGDSSGDMPLGENVKDYIKKKYNKPGDVFLGVVHRLDRPVSGVILFARTSKGLTRMQELFRNKEVKKTYLAIVHGFPKETEGTLKHFLVKDNEKNTVKAFNKEKKDSKEAILRYKLLGNLHGKSLLAVYPETGRSHQIRAQLSQNKNSILGDVKYGGQKADDKNQIYLHALKLEFVHPVKKEKVIIKVLPEGSYWSEFGDIIKAEFNKRS